MPTLLMQQKTAQDKTYEGYNFVDWHICLYLALTNRVEEQGGNLWTLDNIFLNLFLCMIYDQ